MSDFRNRAFQYFTQQGWSPHAAAALAGQGNWESRGNPVQIHDGGIGIGLYGWNGDRRKGLYSFAAQNNLDPENEDTQLKFAQHELTGGNERKWGEALRNAGDLSGATNAVLGYLRPSGWTEQNPMGGHGYVQRYNEAAPLVNASPMAQALAMGPTKNIGFGPQPAMQQAQAPVDPRTAGDADMGGYGGNPRVWDEGKKPFSTAMQPQDLTKLGMGLLAAGSPQQTMQPMQVPMGQAYRGNPAALSLLDSLTKRGLLG